MIVTLFRIAEAQLRIRWRQTLIALTSIAIGVAMLVLTLSLTGGLSQDFIGKALETSPHVEVLPRRPASLRTEAIARPGELVQLDKHHVPDEKRTVRPLPAVLAQARAFPEVTLATPAVEAQAVLAYGTTRRPALVVGVVPREEALLTVLDERVVAGRWEDLETDRDGAVLGAQLARALGVTVGSPLQALGAEGAVVPLNVVAIVSTGLSSVDKSAVLVHLARAQTLAGLTADQATKVRLKLRDPWQAARVAEALEPRIGYVCLSWIQRSSAQVESFARQNLITRVLVFCTMLVAGFGVANVLVQMVAAKRRDIAILRAYGFSRQKIAGVFLLEGTLLALLGSALGCTLGAVLVRVVGSLPVDFGEAALLRNQTLPMAEKPVYYVVATILALVVCTIAATQPARRAAKLLPTAILRGER